MLGDGSNAGAITSLGAIENFTSLNVNNGAWTGAPSGSLDTNTVGTDSALTLNIGGNGILNGSGVTAANHYNTYNQSGNLTVGNGATLNEDYGNGTTPANAPISVANATLGAGDILQQAYTTNTGLFNLSNLTMPTGATLQWQPQGSAPSLNDTSATSTELGEFGFGADTQYKNDSTTSSLYNGDDQGKQLGYPVLTFTGGSGYTTSDTEGIVEPGTANVPQNSTNSNFFSTATAWGKSLYGDIDNSLALDSSQVSNLGVSANQAEVAVMSPTGTVTMAAPNLDFGYYPAYVAVNTAGKIDPNSTHANSEYGAPTNANATQNLESYNTIFSKWIGTGYKLQAEFTTPLMNGNSQLLNVSYWSNSSGSSAQSMSGVTANIAGYKSFGYDNIAGTGANLGTPDQTWVNTNSTSSPTTNTQGTGINLTVPANTASNGAYTGTMTWSVVNAPA